MSVSNEVMNETINYVRWETFAFAFAFMIIYVFSLSFIEVLGKKKWIITMSIVNFALYIILDIFFVSPLPVSLNLGVIGIPISNILTNLISFIATIVILYSIGIKLFGKSFDFTWVKVWMNKGGLSGLESFIRNIVFSLMVVRIANVVTENGTYWMANNFIWQWLLLPTLALSNAIKKEMSTNENFKLKSQGYFLISSLFVVLWLISIPTWRYFVQYAMNFNDYEQVVWICLIQTPFYILFIFNNIMDATFFGKGKIWNLVVQSIIINIFYYTIAFLLFQFNVVTPSLLSLCLMFGIGMALDIIPTTIQYWIYIKKMNGTWVYRNYFPFLEKPLVGGRSTANVVRCFNRVYRPYKPENELSNKFLKFLEEKGFNYSQRFIGMDNKNRCVYSFTKGFVPKEIGETNTNQLYQFIDIVNSFHSLSKEFQNENKTYCHMDLSPCNVVFDKTNKPMCIIDWDGVECTNRLEDICYVLWLWINLGSLDKDNKLKINELVDAINYWHLTKEEHSKLKNAFLNRMQKVIDNLPKDNYQYSRTSDWVKYSKKWINDNWSKITNKLK